ncbi:MAG: carboxypeptidase-like regulatory domain-containing protein [Fusobacteriota bacterium]
MKKILLLISLSFLFIGCSADVTVNAVSTEGGPVAGAQILFEDENGGTYQTNTGPSGEAQVNLEYGTYSAVASKEDYESANHSSIKVTLVGAIFGIQADMVLKPKDIE